MSGVPTVPGHPVPTGRQVPHGLSSQGAGLGKAAASKARLG